MTIIDYRSSTDLDVIFEDKTIIRNRSYDEFKKGKIKNKNYKPRIGETGYNNQGCLMKIVEYFNNKNFTVEFQDDHKYKVYNVCYANFKRGEVKNPYYKSICNIGYLGEINDSGIKNLQSYKKWCYMLSRCYPITEKQKETHKHYLDCSVCNEWLCFKNFKQWYDENYYEIPGQEMQLDKDVLFKGNRIYSPSTCCFIPFDINHVFGTAKAVRGDYPIGVYYDKKRNCYEAKCTVNRKQIHLGRYSTPEKAFYAYKIFKEKRMKELADMYKDYLPNKVYEALYNWSVEITD